MATVEVAKSNIDLKGVPVGVQSTIITFIESAHNIRFFQPDGEPNHKSRLFNDGTLQQMHKLAWDAALEEAYQNGRGLEFIPECGGAVNSRDMAWNEDYHKAFAAALRVALDNDRIEPWREVWCEAWNSVYDTVFQDGITKGLDHQQAHVNAHGVALDVALSACLKLVGDLDYLDKADHEAHMTERMEIRQKGYCIVAYVNGIPYAYAEGDQIASRGMLRNRIAT